MRVFVSGARGFVGRALVQQLETDGWHVVAWTREHGDLAEPCAALPAALDRGGRPSASCQRETGR